MPIREYRCEACGETVERITPQGLADHGPCEKCGGATERIISAPAKTPDKWKV